MAQGNSTLAAFRGSPGQGLTGAIIGFFIAFGGLWYTLHSDRLTQAYHPCLLLFLALASVRIQRCRTTGTGDC